MHMYGMAALRNIQEISLGLVYYTDRSFPVPILAWRILL
jgi:hypothetical protein